MLAICFGASLWAQSPTGRITGTVTASQGSLSGVSIRAKNLETGAVIEATTGGDGSYSVELPKGSYDVFFLKVCYAQIPHRNVAVASGGALRMDQALPGIINCGTPGELGALLSREAHPPPSGPAPRTADGKPDLSGVWYPGGLVDPEEVPYQPWAAALARGRQPKDDPRAHCLPTGVERGNAIDLSKIIQTPTELVMLFDGSPPGFRQIFLDGRGHPEHPEPAWMGHSIGKWEGDTLVVDTVGFNDKVWMDGNTPQTESLHTTERLRRVDLGHLDLAITIEDPAVFTRPWKLHRVLALAPKEELLEYICNENEKTEHYVGRP